MAVAEDAAAADGAVEGAAVAVAEGGTAAVAVYAAVTVASRQQRIGTAVAAAADAAVVPGEERQG